MGRKFLTSPSDLKAGQRTAANRHNVAISGVQLHAQFGAPGRLESDAEALGLPAAEARYGTLSHRV